jgi:hypothetical protein
MEEDLIGDLDMDLIGDMVLIGGGDGGPEDGKL